MKLIFQIALGVFLGTLAAQITLTKWQRYGEEQLSVEREKARLEQADRFRDLFLEQQKRANPRKNQVPPGFIPDDAGVESMPSR